MADYALNEMLQFLTPESRIDLKHISLDYLLGLSGTETGVQALLQNEQLMQTIIDLTDDEVEEVAKSATLMLVNVTADATGASEILKYKPSSKENIVELLIGYVKNPNKKCAHAACMILSNITRQEKSMEVCLDTLMPHLDDILSIFQNVHFSPHGMRLHYLAPLFSNLSCSPRVRKWLTDGFPDIPLMKIMPFCTFDASSIRRGGAVGTIRNVAFEPNYHSLLLHTKLDLLTYLLAPLMGNEDYPDDEMDKLPIALQYLPNEKKREEDPDIRKMVIETFHKLCVRSHSREVLRDNGVYYVLREYHKWEKNPELLLACEKVVDILIQNEDEVGAEDLSTVQIPDDLTDRFQAMDDEYINSMS